MLTAFSYARFSSSGQNESSIEAQNDAILRYAAQHGIKIVHQYVDRARSGTNDNRPDFQRMIADLRADPVDLVLVHKTDRFARNRYDAAIYSRMIQDRGARLVAVAQDFGDGPESIILEGLLQAMAEYYSLNLSTEVKKGMHVRAKEGKYAGRRVPFGYRGDGNGGLVLEPVEAEYVRRLYEARLTGKPYGPILKEMREAGVTGRGGGILAGRGVPRILLNPIYAGIYQITIDGQLYRHENHHPAIVTMAEFTEVCKLVKNRMAVGRKPKAHAYVCTGLLICGKCGARLNGRTKTTNYGPYFYYGCSSACGLGCIPALEIEKAACDYVNALLVPELCDKLTIALQEYQLGQTRASKRRIPSAQKEIKQLRAEIDALIANMSTGVLPASVLERLGQQIAQKEERIKILEALSTTSPQFDSSQIKEYFSNCASISPDDDPEVIKRTLHRFIECIIVYPDRFEITSTLNSWLAAHHPDLITPTRSIAEASNPQIQNGSIPSTSTSNKSILLNPEDTVLCCRYPSLEANYAKNLSGTLYRARRRL